MRKEAGSEMGRGLELLWGPLKPPARGPKPGLSLEGIVGAAIQLADEEGLEALSMRRVAERLGFTTMSLYRYVPGKDELIDVMLDTALGGPPAPEVGADWRSALARWARANRELYRRHGWLLEVTLRRPPLGPNQLRWLDAALQAIAELGLEPELLLDVVVLVEQYVQGAARIEVGLAAAARRHGITDGDWGPLYAQVFARVVADERFPALSRAITAGAFGHDGRDSFEFGLQRVLDGIAALRSCG